VGFRWFVQREAERLQLDGWVANQLDGTVEVVAEGSEERLERLLSALWEGPLGSSVSRVEVHHEPARGNLPGFLIRSGAHRGD
jgi:acylphosphatase